MESHKNGQPTATKTATRIPAKLALLDNSRFLVRTVELGSISPKAVLFPVGHGKSVNRSRVGIESAFANLTIFSSAMFRSPRSTPPT